MVAPAPARRSPHNGPAQSADRSTTRRPATARGAAGPRACRTIPPASSSWLLPSLATSPTRATGRPNSCARSTRGSGSRPARCVATEDQIAGVVAGTSSSSSQAGTVSRSSRRGNDTATWPCAVGSRRQLPPQLVAPRRHNPMSAARSPRSASASRLEPPTAWPRRSTASTRRAGGPEGWSTFPVSAMAPLAAQRVTRGSSTWGRVTSGDPRPPQRRRAPRRVAQRPHSRTQRRCPGRPRGRPAGSGGYRRGATVEPAVRCRRCGARTGGARLGGPVRRGRGGGGPRPRAGGGEPGGASDHGHHAGTPASQPG